MSKQNPKILVIATSRNTRGGITSVVKAHQQGKQWEKYHCQWIETHIDKGGLHKLIYLIKGFLRYMICLPTADLVHIHASEPVSGIRKIPFLFLAKLSGKKTIVHFHAFSPETTIRSKYRSVYHYLFSKADRVIVLSNYWKSELESSFKLDNKIVILYNPCSEPERSISYSPQKYILYAGTINQRKGYSDLIKAFALISTQFPEWKIVFAGNGEIEDGISLAKALSIANKTIFLGWVNGLAKSKAFQEASIFCLPSYAEGFPMAVLDAWAYGLPVVTTPVGGLPDILKDGINGLSFAPGDIKVLAQQLKIMIENDKLRANISIESERLAKEVFNPEVICNQLERIYEDLLI
ncbi:MAG: glycosyltransferase family 4 protein [Dysgonamonadaceae bacterium]